MPHLDAVSIFVEQDDAPHVRHGFRPPVEAARELPPLDAAHHALHLLQAHLLLHLRRAHLLVLRMLLRAVERGRRVRVRPRRDRSGGGGGGCSRERPPADDDARGPRGSCERADREY